MQFSCRCVQRKQGLCRSQRRFALVHASQLFCLDDPILADLRAFTDGYLQQGEVVVRSERISADDEFHPSNAKLWELSEIMTATQIKICDNLSFDLNVDL